MSTLSHEPSRAVRERPRWSLSLVPAMWAGSFVVCLCAPALAGSGVPASVGVAPPRLVYQQSAALASNYTCADVPRQYQRLLLWPGRVSLPPAGQAADDPSWSPSGQRIAFSSGDLLCTNGDGIGQLSARIWVVDATGRNLRALTRGDPVTGGPLDRSPSWSPDGSRIAFARFDITRGAGGIYVVGADGGHLAQLSRQTAVALDWSRDGRSIAFIPGQRLAFGDSAAPRIALLDVHTRRVRTLRHVAAPNAVAWSPGGRTIAVAEDHTITLLGKTGKVVRRIPVPPVPRGYVSGVTWSPDGRHIAYSSGGSIFTIGVDGRDAERILAGNAPDWRP